MLVKAVSLGVAIAAIGVIFLNLSTPKAPHRRVVQASVATRVWRTADETPASAPLPEATLSGAPSADEAPPAQSGGEAEDIASHLVPSEAPSPDPAMDEVNQYLWSVYERSTTKRDGSGDFTWKDIAAAARLGMSLGDYVIVGMDPDFREILYRAGRAMDAAGMRWNILSGFRDDYRQGLAAGYKARIGDSLHGGSFTTGGYGHGCAVDINDADGKSYPLWKWLDGVSAAVNLERPLPGIDPAHIQPRGPWHEQAAALRKARLDKTAAGETGAGEDSATAGEAPDLNVLPPTDADLTCIGLHHHRQIETAQADTAPPAPPRSFKAAARAHGGGRIRRAEAKNEAREKEEAKSTSKAVVRAADSAKPSAHGRAAARSQARHALRATPRTAGTT